MALQNVEKLEIQQSHKKTWFQRFRGKAAAVSATCVALVVSTGSQAFMDAADIDAATGAAGGDSLLQKVGIWMLGFVVGMTIYALIISMVKKK